jgi:type VI secretion system protein ImpG
MSTSHELLSYYHAELGYLRRAGAEFARRHPKAAARLELGAEECPDPHVERLIESVAFLTGRIRRELDRELPEVAAALLEVMYPHFLRPVPSMTIARLQPDPKQATLAGGHVVPRHTPLFAQTSDGTACRFRTCYPATLWPLEVAHAALESADRYDWLDGGRTAAVLRVQIQATGAPLDELEGFDSLRFYLGADARTGAVLYERLFSALGGVALVPEGTGAPVFLGPDAVRPVGFGEDEDVIPWPAHAHPAYRLLQEHFAVPRKFLFADVHGLARHGSRKRFDLVFLLDRTVPDRVVVDRDSFQIGCAPVVNLFRRTSEPVRLDHRTHEYRLVGDYRRERTTEIHSVLRVAATADARDETRVLEPFFSFSHEADTRGARAFWHARRVASERADLRGTDVMLSFVDLDFNPARPATDTVFAQVECTNRGLAEALPAGHPLQVEVPAPLSGVTALHVPTPQLDPPVGSAAMWRLVSQLSLNHLSLDGEAGVQAMREILRLYAPYGRASVHQEIGGVRALRCRPVARRIGSDAWRGFVRGTEVEVTLDEDAFPGGGAFLMAAVLDRFFGRYAALNSFTQTVLRSRQREEAWMRWPPRAGRQPLV